MQHPPFPVAFGADTMLTRPPHVLQILDAPGNVLRVLVALTKQGLPPYTDNCPPMLQQVLSPSIELCPNMEELFEITFEGYILYQVGNESYCRPAPAEQFRGQYFLVFDCSCLLQRLEEFSDCQQLPDGSCYPAPWKHYGICALDHTIHVISPNEPIIQRRTNTHLPPLQD